MFLINSRRSRFSVASKSVNLQRHPLSRTYGVILQSSLTTVLPSALDFSSRLPVSVLVRLSQLQPLEAFLGHPSNDFLIKRQSVSRLELRGWIYLSLHLSAIHEHFYPSDHFPDAVPPSVHCDSAGILTCCPSSTPFGLD